jgi:hypothetical protein
MQWLVLPQYLVEPQYIEGYFKRGQQFNRLFKKFQMQDAQKTEPQGVYVYTLSGAVCSATPAVAGVNSADACPAYAGSFRVTFRVFQRPRKSLYPLLRGIISNNLWLLDNSTNKL